MIGDVITMIWKEMKELLRMRGSSRRGMVAGMFLPVGILGIYLPLQSGEAWVTRGFSLAAMGWLPLFLTISIIADSFAGERERRTLETLLASRLSDQAVLIGKIASAVLYSWGLVVVSVVVGLITVNLVHGHGRLLMFPAMDLIAMLVFTFLLGLLAGCAGVLVSLRAATVRQAAQTLSYGFLAVVLGGVFGVRAMPQSWIAALLGVLAGSSLIRMEVYAALFLIAVDLALYSAARARFQRARLILE